MTVGGESLVWGVKTPRFSFRPMATVLVATTLVVTMPNSDAFLKKLFGKSDPDTLPPREEIQAQDNTAASMIAQAEQAAEQGKTASAIKTYKRVKARYPLTDSAATAAFRLGGLYESEGKISSAFDAYQDFIDTYKTGANFRSALDRQFAIANEAKDGAKVKWLGISRRLESSRIIEMYDSVISNAPRAATAPQARYAIGEIYERDRDIRLARNAYQEVVDDFPGSTQARDAQLAIANMSFDEVEDGSYDAENLTAAGDAMDEFLLTNPDDTDNDLLNKRAMIDESSAEKSFQIAQYYEKQGQLKAAAIYYSEVARTPSSAKFGEARERLADIASADPEAVTAAPGVESATDLVVAARSDVKDRKDYLGPPAPALHRMKAKPKMRTGSKPKPSSSPVFEAIEEPALPSNTEIDLMTPIDGEALLLPPPPAPPGGEPLSTPPTIEETAIPVPPPPPAPPISDSETSNTPLPPPPAPADPSTPAEE